MVHNAHFKSALVVLVLVLLDMFVNISLQDWLFISMLRPVDNWNLAVLPTPASILPFQNMINMTSQLYW